MPSLQVSGEYSGSKAHVSFAIGAASLSLGGIVIALIARDTQGVIELLKSWGPWVLLSAVILIALAVSVLVFLKVSGDVVNALTKNALSMQEISTAFRGYVERDDEQIREMQLVMNYVARDSKATREEMREVKTGLAAVLSRLEGGK